MSFTVWLQRLTASRARRAKLDLGTGRLHRGLNRRLRLEPLEDRRLLAFSPVTTFPVGTNPQAVVTADFNNDGKSDLATSNYGEAIGDGTVSVLLGNGGGSFQPAQNSAPGWYPISLAAGDFNADGKLDLATANYNDISILLGKGDGTFDAPVGLTVTESYFSYPSSITTGDLNADGKLDLVVTFVDDVLDGHISVLLGHGDGTFAADITTGPYYGQLFSPVLADINGDGRIDVAVASFNTNSVMVFLGYGDGGLQEPRVFGTGPGPDSVAAGDFNGDGKLDLAAANYYSNSVSMLLGNGDGNFQTARSFAAGTAPHSATTSDVNSDGKLDLVVNNPISAPFPGAVSVLLGNGDGSLAAPITTATGGSPTSVVMADFNGDGRPDAAAANTGSNNVSVLINDGIWNSVPPPPSIGIDNVSLQEGATKKTTLFSFTVTLSAPSAESVTVNFATAGGTATAGIDYVSKTGTVTFLPGETSKQITILVKGEKTKEPDETFFVNLSNASGATIEDGQGLGTILNDDTGGTGGKRTSSASAVDAALNEWLNSGRKKRTA